MEKCSLLNRDILDSISNIIFDCDGVIWKNGTLIPGVRNTLNILRKVGKRLIFLTNNSTQSRNDLFLKFSSLDLLTEPSSIFNSGYIMALHLKNLFLESTTLPSLYVIGGRGLVEELEKFEFKVLGAEEDSSKIINKDDLAHIKEWDNHSVSAVIVGNDWDISYYKIARAVHYLRKDKECLFFCTNRDPIFPSSLKGFSLPAAGVMVSAIECGSGRKAKEPLGKPNHLIFDLLSKDLSLEGGSMMVGDNLETDILFGRRVGMKTLLVETGVHSLKDAKEVSESEMPHYVSSDVNVFSDLLE